MAFTNYFGVQIIVTADGVSVTGMSSNFGSIGVGTAGTVGTAGLPTVQDPQFKFLGAKNVDLYEVGFDDFYIWNKQISIFERQALYNAGDGYSWPFPELVVEPYRIVSGVTLTNNGLNYVIAPTITIDDPIGGGDTATAVCVMTSDATKIYADHWPAFSVGNTNNVVTSMMQGSGSFVRGNNDFLRVGNILHSPDWSVFINFTATGSRPTGVSRVLVSSMESVNQKSGLIFGINDANRLFFEYIDTGHALGGQRRVFVHEQELGENNIVSVSADSIHGSITVCNHNPAKQNSYGMSYYAAGYKASDTLFLAGFPNSTNDPKYTGFYGLFKDVLVLNASANTAQLNALAPLFCLTGYTPEGEVPIYTYYPIITGATFTETVIATGVTGYALNTTSIPDKDGVDISVYDLLPLTGQIIGTGVVYESGEMSGVRVAYSGIPEQLFYNDAYVKKYGDENFVMLRYPILSGDLTEVYSFDTKWEDKISVMPQAFNLNDFYFADGFDSDNANVYYNGLLQVTGIDYQVASGKIVSNSLAQYKSIYSYLLYDEISGTTVASGWTGWNGEYVLGGNVTANGSKDIYLGGQKLISGIDYTVNGNNTTLVGTQFGETVSWSSGVFAFAPSRTGVDRLRFTGSGLGYWHDFTSSLGKLMDEMVYVNGQRLAPTIDYKTVAADSLLNTDYRAGGWSQFWVYTGDLFSTGVTALRPDLSSAFSDTLVTQAPPTPQ